MITIVTGKPGHGKTLYALWLLGNAVAAGRPCFTNIQLSPACPFADYVAYIGDESEVPVWREWSEGSGRNAVEHGEGYWEKLRDVPGFFLIDEIDNYFDSAEFARLAEFRESRRYWKQHRKHKHDVVGIVQNVDNLYVRIRRMANAFILCEHSARVSGLGTWLPLGWSSFSRVAFAGEPFSERNLIGTGAMSYREGAAMFGWYSTDQVIGGIGVK